MTGVIVVLLAVAAATALLGVVERLPVLLVVAMVAVWVASFLRPRRPHTRP